MRIFGRDDYDAEKPSPKRGREQERNGVMSALSSPGSVGSILADYNPQSEGRKVRRIEPLLEDEENIDPLDGFDVDYSQFMKCPACGGLKEFHSQVCTGCLQDARHEVGLP